MDQRRLRWWVFLLSLPPPPSPQIWTNITWFFNIYANKSQQVISWSVLTEFIWSCRAARFESRGIKHKIILATCSRNCERIRKLTRGLEVALRDQKQTEGTSGNAFKNAEVTLGAFDFQLELWKGFLPTILVFSWEGVQVCRYWGTSWIRLSLTDFFWFGCFEVDVLSG